MTVFFPPRPVSAGAALAALLLSAGAAQAQACPDWSQQGAQLTYGASALVQGASVPVVAGGNVDLSRCNIPGGAWGNVITAPDFHLALTDGPVSLNPEIIVSNAPAGAYDIWIGTFGTQTCQASLILALEGGAEPEVLPDPGNMMAFRGQAGAVFQFAVTGSNAGTIWGSGVYTDDSPVATAAVHAGVLQVGQSGVVTVAVVGGQPSYPGMMSNGIQSADYGSWDGSYQFLDAEGNPITVMPPAASK